MTSLSSERIPFPEKTASLPVGRQRVNCFGARRRSMPTTSVGMAPKLTAVGRELMAES